MSWSKGAVVVVKRGDEAIADAIEKGMDIQSYSKKEVEDMERDNVFMKKRSSETFAKLIEKAEEDYGYNPVPPQWAKGIISVWAFIVYHVCTFVERYLRI